MKNHASYELIATGRELHTGEASANEGQSVSEERSKFGNI